mgnify:CR=1 FL=1
MLAGHSATQVLLSDLSFVSERVIHLLFSTHVVSGQSAIQVESVFNSFVADSCSQILDELQYPSGQVG